MVVFADLIGPSNLAPGLPRPTFNLVPFGSLASGRTTEEVIGNLILFSPMGVLLPFVSARFRALWLVCTAAFVLSFLLEVLQYAMNVGRLSDIDDSILNAAGAAFGWLTWRIAESSRISRGTT